MKPSFIFLMIHLAFSSFAWAQAGKTEDQMKNFLSEVSREDLRKMEAEYARKTNHTQDSKSREIAQALRAKANGKTWTFVLTKKDDKILGAIDGRPAFQGGTEKDSFRFEGTVIFPDVRIEAAQALIEKVKDVRPGREIRVTGTITEVMFGQRVVMLTTKSSETRMVLNLTLHATDCGPK